MSAFWENMGKAVGQPQPVADAVSGWSKKPEDRTLGDGIYGEMAKNKGYVPDPHDWTKKT